MLPESIKREIKAGKCFYHVNDPYRIHISRVDSDAVVISSCPFLSEQKSEILPTGFDCMCLMWMAIPLRCMKTIGRLLRTIRSRSAGRQFTKTLISRN